MEMSIDNSICLLEKYLDWQKLHGLNGSGIDEATSKLLEVAKKYQKIEQIINNAKDLDGAVKYNWLYEQIREVIENADSKNN